METEGGSPPPEAVTRTPETQSIDAKWFGKLEPLLEPGPIDSFKGETAARNEEKKKFLESNSGNPDLDYPNLDVGQLQGIETGLLGLKDEVLHDEKNDVLRQTYRWKINERIAEVRMLKAAANGDMRRFARYSDFVYGSPSKEVYDYTVESLLGGYREQKTSDDPEIAKAASFLLEELQLAGTTPDIKGPSEDDYSFVKEKYKGDYKKAGVHLDEEVKRLDSTQIAAAFEQALQGIEADEWVAKIVDSADKVISVSQDKREIQVPETMSLGRIRTMQLVLHEALTHVQRRLNGEKTVLSLLSVGLDRNEKGEEGVATMAESGFKKEFKEFSRLDYHLAISLAKGLGQKTEVGEPRGRDFRQVFEIMKNYYYLENRGKDKDHDESLRLAGDKAWGRCVRTFRGTDCKTPGACFTKDMVYREGEIAAWYVVSADRRMLEKFTLGKYDPANPRHLWILSQLGILDSDLEKLAD